MEKASNSKGNLVVIVLCLFLIVCTSFVLPSLVINAGPNVLDIRVSSDADDAEEVAVNGYMYTGSSDLELINNPDSNEDQVVGIRFTNVSVPKGAIITKAYIQFTAKDASSGDASLVIRAQNSDNPKAFAATDYNVSSRPVTASFVNWSPAAWNTVNEAAANQRTPDLKSILQEVVNRTGWSSGNPVVFSITGTSGSSRSAYSYSGNSGKAPLLHVEYSLPEVVINSKISADTDDAEENIVDGSMYIDSTDLEMVNEPAFVEPLYVGLRFQNVAIPKGATITNAYVQFTAKEVSTGPASLVIKAQDADNPTAFMDSDRNVSSRPTASTSVSWSPAEWGVKDEAGINQRTPNINAVLQQTVNRTNWASGNSIVLFVSGSQPSRRCAYSYKGSPSKAPLLHIEYNGTNVLEIRLSGDADDAEENVESGKVHLESTDLELVRDLGWAKDQIVGLRFQNIDIPKDATVKNAYIQFTAKEAGSNSPSIVIRAQASDNAEGFNNTKYNISSRAVTAASVSWNPPVWNNVNESGINQRTPDLANLLQEVVNRSNWTRGNSMAFIISGSKGNNVCAYSFKGSNTYAPVLHVEYILSNPGPSTTPGSEYNVYFGTLHNHSTVSDGRGTPAEAYSYARDVGFLDFFALSDHSDAISAEEWAETKNIADSFNQDGVFTTFRGFEWSSGTHGHVTIINTDDYCGTVDSSTNTFPEISSWIASRDCAAFLNHPGRENGEGKEFSHLTTTPNNNFVGMELWNKRDNFSVYYYNDGYYADDGNMGYFDEALLRKWRIGAGGGDDNHNANWGTHNNHRLAVLAKANTRAEIYNALKERRFYSTLDKNLRLSFEVNGYQMGSFINPGTYNAVIKASDDNQEIFTRVEMIKNGVVVNTWTPNMENPVITQSISTASGDYYYIRVRQSDGNEAISSPVFIN